VKFDANFSKNTRSITWGTYRHRPQQVQLSTFLLQLSQFLEFSYATLLDFEIPFDRCINRYDRTITADFEFCYYIVAFAYSPGGLSDLWK